MPDNLTRKSLFFQKVDEYYLDGYFPSTRCYFTDKDNNEIVIYGRAEVGVGPVIDVKMNGKIYSKVVLHENELYYLHDTLLEILDLLGYEMPKLDWTLIDLRKYML